MNKIILASTLLCALSAVPSTSFASDPCEVVLCMYGKATGNSGDSACKSAENAFFDIVKKKHGAFLPDQTADARESFLKGCPAAPADIVAQIIQAYGRISL